MQPNKPINFTPHFVTESPFCYSLTTTILWSDLCHGSKRNFFNSTFQFFLTNKLFHHTITLSSFIIAEFAGTNSIIAINGLLTKLVQISSKPFCVYKHVDMHMKLTLQSLITFLIRGQTSPHGHGSHIIVISMGCSTQLLNFPLVDEITTLLQCKSPRSYAMYNLHITTIFKNDTYFSIRPLPLICQWSISYFLVIFSSGFQGKFRITTSSQNGTHIFISKYCHLLNTHMCLYIHIPNWKWFQSKILYIFEN